MTATRFSFHLTSYSAKHASMVNSEIYQSITWGTSQGLEIQNKKMTTSLCKFSSSEPRASSAQLGSIKASVNETTMVFPRKYPKWTLSCAAQERPWGCPNNHESFTFSPKRLKVGPECETTFTSNLPNSFRQGNMCNFKCFELLPRWFPLKGLLAK